MKPLYVYMLLCADDSIYTGVTNNVDTRFAEHNEGLDETTYTYSRRPLKIIYIEAFQIYHQAIDREKQLKRWTRAKKMALATGDFEELERLSKKKKKTWILLIGMDMEFK